MFLRVRTHLSDRKLVPQLQLKAKILSAIVNIVSSIYSLLVIVLLITRTKKMNKQLRSIERKDRGRTRKIDVFFVLVSLHAQFRDSLLHKSMT